MMATESRKALAWALLVMALTQGANAGLEPTVEVLNVGPHIISITTYSLYLDSVNNVPATSFEAPDKKTVYIQIKVRDDNGFSDIVLRGSVKFKIVLWNGTHETDFSRFGSSYLNASFESGSGLEAVYRYAYVMANDDETRLGTPMYYRVKAEVSDDAMNESSNISSNNADYIYQCYISPHPPVQVLFDVSIDIPSNKKTIYPGDSFYAVVAITKMSPAGLDDIQIDYDLIDPINRTVDHFSEMVAINNTLYRVPVLYVSNSSRTGNYTFRVTVSYLGTQAWSEAFFNVLAYPTTTSSTTSTTSTTWGTNETTTTTTRRSSSSGGSSGGDDTDIDETQETGETSAPTTTLPPNPEVSLQSPSEVQAFSGDTKPILVVVENTGNVAVNDVTVFLGGALSVQKVIPERIDSLEPGASAVFIIDAKIPDDLVPADYDAVVKIISNDAVDEKSMKFVVLAKPLETGKVLTAKADDLNKLVDQVWSEAIKSGLSEDDESLAEVFSLLQASKDNINKAREDISGRQYESGQEEMDTAKARIEESVIKLASIKADKAAQQTNTIFVPIKTPSEITPSGVAAVTIAISALLLLGYDLYSRKRRGKRLEELYDLRATKDMIFGHMGGQGHKTSVAGSPGDNKETLNAIRKNIK